MKITMERVFGVASLVVFSNLVIKFATWTTKYIQKIRVVNKMKGCKMLPFIGSLHLLKSRKDLLMLLCEVSKTCKTEPVWRIWLGWRPLIFIQKADCCDIVLSSAKHTKKAFFYDVLQQWIGKGIFLSYDENWQKRRRLITPSFHFEILNDFLHVMNEQADVLVEKLSKLAEEKSEIDIFALLKMCALDIICETAMGQNVNAQNGESSEYVKSVTRTLELIIERILIPPYWSDFIYSFTTSGKEYKKCLKTLHAFTKKVIVERDAQFNNTSFSDRKRAAFLDLLLRAKYEKEEITFDDIREEVDTFMAAGHDTLGVATAWACQMIGSYPEVQKKLHEEIDCVLGGSDRELTNDDLNSLKYLECVIKESLRLYPSIPYFGRTLTEDDQIGDYRAVKGDTVVIFTYMIHRDEKYYPDPEKFDPDRFLPENSKERHPYAFIPFSAGRRNCIGQKFAMMEEKVMLVKILRKFEIKALKTIEELEPVIELGLHPANGLLVELKTR